MSAFSSEKGRLARARASGQKLETKHESSFFTPDPRQGLSAHLPDVQLKGEPLDSSVENSMSSYYGADLSDVQVLHNEEGDRIARMHGATAVAFGRQIAFRTGAYQPGTPAGDALLAHELAHVVQQQGDRQTAVGTIENGFASQELENDANRSLVGYMMRRMLGLGQQRISRKPIASKRRFAACTQAEQIETPNYLGPHSHRAIQDINRILENSALLSDVLVLGVLVNVSTTAPHESLAQGGPGDTIEYGARALHGIPAIRRNRIEQVIGLLLIQHGNEMNAQERQFWKNIQQRLLGY